MESEAQDQTRPAPVDLDDPQAFYVSYYGYSMVPAGIGPADFCPVSPCVKLEPGQRIWLSGDWRSFGCTIGVSQPDVGRLHVL